MPRKGPGVMESWSNGGKVIPRWCTLVCLAEIWPYLENYLGNSAVIFMDGFGVGPEL